MSPSSESFKAIAIPEIARVATDAAAKKLAVRVREKFGSALAPALLESIATDFDRDVRAAMREILGTIYLDPKEIP